MSTSDLRNLNTHFAFGENWRSFATRIDDAAIEEATRDLLRLVDAADIRGRSFLDIGSGSGLHSLCAAKLGAARLLAVDIDPASVETTRTLLRQQAAEFDAVVHQASIFDLSPDELGSFDVVYSWGVLHHTGDLIAAIGKAVRLVKPGGKLVLALYRRTYLDWFWRWEKKFYSNASSRTQKRIQRFYDFFFQLAKRVTQRKQRQPQRGMEYWHDIHDWLGGYPYESISEQEVDELLTRLGLVQKKVFARPTSLGVFGSGCDEFVYAKPLN